jgi:predicted nucleotidyltransferase
MDKKRQKQLDEIVAVIKDNIDPVSIYLFGSLASGNFQEDSDIDLLIVAPSKDRPLERRIKLRKLLIEYDRYLGLDLLVYTPEEYNMLINEPSSFIHSITKNGLKLYDQKAA